MKTNRKATRIIAFVITTTAFLSSCVPNQIMREARVSVPDSFGGSSDTVNCAQVNWKAYFGDVYLAQLIDTALIHNQELNVLVQEIAIQRNEIRERKGEYLPFVDFGAVAESEKPGEFTRNGSVEKNLKIKDNREFPEPLTNLSFGAYASWEVDVWKKLRNAKKAAVMRYLASVEGRNFMITQLVSVIAEAYYELLSLDNQLRIVEQNIKTQSNALKVVQQQKQSAKVTQLAVNRFEAQLLNTINLQFEIKQRIVETENKIHYLCGHFPSDIKRNTTGFIRMDVDSIHHGIPTQLLANRPDIRQAEMDLEAAKLDVHVARARFYPSVSITSRIGFESFNPQYLIEPKSVLYNLAGDIIAPVVNRNAIKAQYSSAGARKVQHVITYEQRILGAYVDVLNQLGKLKNYRASFETKSKEVQILTQSIQIANNLFYSARADYTEVLLTQEEALESRMELIEIKLKQLKAKVNIYRALGGGWN